MVYPLSYSRPSESRATLIRKTQTIRRSAISKSSDTFASDQIFFLLLSPASSNAASWSADRILGNFLLYRETEKRGAGHRGARNDAEQVGDQSPGDGPKSEGQTLSRPRGETTRLGIDRQRERSLVGSLTNSYKFKNGGMTRMKKVGSIF